MKWALITLVIIDLFLLVMAGVRLSTARAETEPLFRFTSFAQVDAPTPSAREKQPGIGETGTGKAVVEHLRPSHVDEMAETATISTSNVQGNTDYNASAAVDRASAVTENREDDLDDAKKKIGKIGK